MTGMDAGAPSLAHRARPPRRAGAGQPPALLLLHGRGADEMDLLGLAGVLDPRLAIISARAPFPLGPGYHWYDLLEIGAVEPTSYAAARARLAAFLDEATAAHGLDPARLYALGFSQGAVMAGGLALTLPGRLAGAVLLSGYLPLGEMPAGGAADLHGWPVFVGHGLHDPLIPITHGRRTRDELRRLGADLTYREYPIQHTIGEHELADIAAWLTALLDE